MEAYSNCLAVNDATAVLKLPLNTLGIPVSCSLSNLFLIACPKPHTAECLLKNSPIDQTKLLDLPDGCPTHPKNSLTSRARGVFCSSSIAGCNRLSGTG